MTASLPQPDETSPLGRERALDRLCDQFEQACRANRFPRIEDYLAQVPPQDHDVLLRELILLEVAYRRKNGIGIDSNEYRQHFRTLDSQWLASALESSHPGAQETPTDNELSTPANLSTGPSPASPPPRPDRTPGSPATPSASPQANSVIGSAKSSTDDSAQRIRCPHCHNPIVLLDDRPDEVLCPGCGSSFRLREANSTVSIAPMQLGKFQLLERVGLGSFGAVWRARDTVLNCIVALKIPHAGLTMSAEDLRRFKEEARKLAMLRDRGIGIITVHEVPELNGMPAIVSNFVDGVTLRDLVQSRRLTFPESAKLVAEVAEALHQAHQLGVVHRDMKPANIMVEWVRNEAGQRARAELGRPWILDFGLALWENAEITMTMDGQIIGTPAYMSPEQAAGHGHVADRRSDVFSLGVILYELICGELPFRGSKAMMLRQVQFEEPRAPRFINDRIPRDLQTICLAAMAKEPARRYQSAAGLADDLRLFLKGEPIRTRPAGRVERVWRWCRRHPADAILAASLLVLLMLLPLITVPLAVEMVWQRDEAQRQRNEARRHEDRALALVKDMAKLQHGLGEQYVKVGLHDDAEHVYARAIALLKPLASEHPEDPEYKHLLAVTYTDIGSLHRKTHRFEEAETDFTDALLLLSDVPHDDPASTELLDDLGWCYIEQGNLFWDLDKFPKAESCYTSAIAIYSGELMRRSDHPDYRSRLASAHKNRASICRKIGASRYDDVEKDLNAALRYRLELQAGSQYDPNRQSQSEYDLALVYNLRSLFRERTNRFDEAKEDNAEARRIAERLFRKHPAVLDYRSLVGVTLESRAWILLGQHARSGSPQPEQLAEARRLLTSSIQWQRATIEGNPFSPDYHEFWRNACNNLVETMMRQNDHAAAYEATLGIIAALPGNTPRDDRIKALQLALRLLVRITCHWQFLRPRT